MNMWHAGDGTYATILKTRFRWASQSDQDQPETRT